LDKDNIKTNLQEMAGSCMLDASGSQPGAVAGFVNKVMNLRVPWMAEIAWQA